MLKENPAKLKTTKPKKHKPYVIAEIAELDIVRAAMPERMALAIDLAGDRDMREGEICGLRREDIDFEAGKIHVKGAVKSVKGEKGTRELIWEEPKTDNSTRDIDITDYLIPLLRSHLDTYVGKAPESMLFVAQRTNDYLAPQTLRNAWYKARKTVPRLEHAKMRFHDLRHTALTRMIENGAPLGLVMEQGGHSTVEVAAIYQQVSESKRQEVLENLSKAHAKARGEVPAPTSPQYDDLIGRLKQLVSLHESGVLDDEESRERRGRLLG